MGMSVRIPLIILSLYFCVQDAKNIPELVSTAISGNAAGRPGEADKGKPGTGFVDMER